MNFAPLILMLIIFLSFDFYTYQGIKTVINSLESDILRKFILWFYWFLNGTVIVLLFVGMYMLENDRENAFTFIPIILALFFLALIPKLAYTLILFTEDIGRFFYAAYDSIVGGAESFHFPARRKFISQLGMGVAGVLFGSILYGITKGKYNYKVKNIELAFPDLPKAFDGFKIAQINNSLQRNIQKTFGSSRTLFYSWQSRLRSLPSL